MPLDANEDDERGLGLDDTPEKAHIYPLKFGKMEDEDEDVGAAKAFQQGMGNGTPEGGDVSGIGKMFADAASGPSGEPTTATADATPPMGPPAPVYPPPSAAINSESAKSLGEFAAAAGDSAAPPPTHLSQVAPLPAAPKMDPRFAETQEDLRQNSTVTPKIDPATGKTADKYREGTGGRIGRAFLDAARGFMRGGVRGAISAPLEGAFGNKNSPGYYGKGAVNRQYFVDEGARQQKVAGDTAKIASFEGEQKQKQTEFTDAEKLRNDSMKQAYDQDLIDQKQQSVDERQRHQTETEDLKRKYQDATTPEAKLQAETNARTMIANRLQLNRRDKTLYIANGKLPDDDTISRKLQIEEERIGIERSREARESRKQSVDEGGQWYTSTRELADFKNRTASLDREASSIENTKAQLTVGGTEDKSGQDMMKRADDRLNAITAQKEQVKQDIIKNRPATRGKQPAGAPQQGDFKPITDKTAKSKSGKEYKVGDSVNGKVIKGFSRNGAGEIQANF
jgi:hypothetical protein